MVIKVKNKQFSRSIFSMFQKMISIGSNSMCMVAILCSIIVISGCVNNPKKLSFVVAYAQNFNEKTTPFDEKMYGSSSPIGLDVNANEKIDSLETLISFSNKKRYPFFNETAESYDHALCKKIRDFSESYFKDKSLILVIYKEASYDPSKVDKLSVKDEVLTITFAKPDEEYDTAQVITTFVHIIEVNKKDVKNVNSIETEEIRKGKHKDNN